MADSKRDLTSLSSNSRMSWRTIYASVFLGLYSNKCYNVQPHITTHRLRDFVNRIMWRQRHVLRRQWQRRVACASPIVQSYRCLVLHVRHVAWLSWWYCLEYRQCRNGASCASKSCTQLRNALQIVRRRRPSQIGIKILSIYIYIYIIAQLLQPVRLISLFIFP